MTESVVLDIKNLSSHFFTAKGEIPAVDGVSIRVPAGKIIGIVGESGCGKSMTAMSVMGLLRYPGRVVDGTVTLDGRDITHLSQKELSRVRGNEISMIFQEPMTSLNPVLTVGDQIAEVIYLHQGVSRGESKRRAAEMLEVVGIPRERFNEYPHQFSGGMKQRVVIAMALACNPKLLIADEPTRNLLLRITDPALLSATGGIVQGMSGSPILQDGKLIGAVTHVLVNQPDTGYGIFIENMLEAANTPAA